MDNIHDWVNSAVLIILTVAYFKQDGVLKYMKTAMEAINPDKIIAAQKIIDEGKEYEVKVKVSKQMREVNKMLNSRWEDVNRDFLDQYNELLNMPFNALKEKDWQERETHLQFYPKNAAALRLLFEAYDKGEFPPRASDEDENQV